MKGFRTALSFLTRVPVSGSTDIACAVPWFALVGALVSAATAAMYAGAHWLVPPLPAATIAVMAAVMLTGAFHEDGLGDMADAFWGGYTAERRIEILKDSRQGTFGVLALALDTVLRVALIASLKPAAAFGALIAAGAIGRGSAVLLMGMTPPAADTGLGSAYLQAITRRGVVVGLGSTVVIAVVGMAGWAGPALAAGLVTALAVRHLAVVKIGGVVGDVLGATARLSEQAALVVSAAVVHRGSQTIAWWPQ